MGILQEFEQLLLSQLDLVIFVILLFLLSFSVLLLVFHVHLILVLVLILFLIFIKLVLILILLRIKVGQPLNVLLTFPFFLFRRNFVDLILLHPPVVWVIDVVS